MLRSIKSPQRMMRQMALKIKAGSISLSIAAAGVTNASDLFTSTAHGLETGDRILVTEVGTLPTGLTDDTQYWVIKISADTFKLATTYANAIAGTVQAISSDGVGSNTYALVEEIDGPDKFQVSSLKATGVGVYVIELSNTFAVAPVVVGNCLDVDKCLTVGSDANTITCKVNDIDETAALSDGFFHILIFGSDQSEFY